VAIISETRSVQGFTEVTLHGYGELVVETGGPELSESLVIEADETLLLRIASEVRGNRLSLGFRMPWYEWVTWWMLWLFLPDKRIRYRLRARAIQGLSLSGSGSVTCASLRGDQCRMRISGSGKIAVDGLAVGLVETAISGSGDISCSGAAERFEARISGSGSVRAERLAARQSAVRISGSGDVSVLAVDSLDVRISGSGRVWYAGEPRVQTSISGSGRVRRLQERAR